MTPGNPIVGSTILRRPAIQSPNFVDGSAGWMVSDDGSAEFNNLEIRGTFNGTDYILNSTGFFLYSGTPGAGNLINSVTNFSGTDPYGNIYLTGSASYSNAGGQAVANASGVLFFYTGTLAGGWTQQGSIQADTVTAGQIDIEAAGLFSGNLTVQGTALTVAGVNIIAALSGQPTASAHLSNSATAGTSATAGLTNGTIAGTSGAASAGMAHTHSPGSYAVNNGQHSHGAGSYAVTNDSHVHNLPVI